MTHLLLLLSLIPAALSAAPKAAVAQFQPCVWPNTCAKPAPVLAQFQPCVWPNTCSGRRSATVVL